MWRTSERRFVRHVCLRNPFLLFLLGMPITFPTRSLRFLRAAVRSNSSPWCLHHAHPFVAPAEKSQSHAEKRRVWSQSCGLQDLLQCIDCALSCAMWLLQTDEKLSRLIFWQRWVGSGAASLSAAVGKMWRTAEKEICSTCLSKESMLFVKSKFPLPTRSLRFLRAAARFTSSALLRHTHPFVAAAEKRPVPCREAEGLVMEWWSQEWLQYTDCAPTWLLQRVCQPFSCRCFANVTQCQARFVDMFVSRIHSRHSCLEFQASNPYQKLEVPESGSTLHQLCIIASCPSLRCSWRKEPVSCSEAEGLVTELWSPRFDTYNTVIVSKIWITGYWLCSQLWHVTAANRWTIAEIELLATVGWKWGCQPFSCPCPLNVTHCRREICWTCKETILAIPFGNSKHPLPTRSLRFLRATVRSTSSALCLYYACKRSHPFVAAAGKTCLRQRSRRFGSKIWITGYWLSSQLWDVTAANRWKIAEIELLATVGWKWGCQPFSCPCSLNVRHCRKEICWTCKECIPAIPFGNSKHPLPTRSLRFLRATVHSASSALLHHAHPFVAAAEKTCLMQRSRGFGHGVVVSKICYNAVIVLSVVLCDCCKPMNTCRDWAFSNSGLEVGLSAFLLPMFAKCDALPTRDLLDMKGIHSCHSFCEFQASTPYQKLEVPKSHSTLHQLCIVLASWTSLCCSCRKNLSHAEKQRVWSQSCGLQSLLQCSDCALNCDMWLLQTDEHLSWLSF